VNAKHSRFYRGAAYALALGALALAGSACGVGVEADYPDGAYYDYPPDAYIATTDPIYFDGHASYWYGNRWYYRDGGRWNHYDHEPPGLAQRRFAAPPVRHNYERFNGHVGGHVGGGGHGGGGRGRR
jgi:hypothetical protein